jgi:hypothetical protein
MKKMFFFEPHKVETGDRNEKSYQYFVRFRGVPCIQEARSVIRIKLSSEYRSRRGSQKPSA